MTNPVEWAEREFGAQQVWEQIRQANLDYEQEQRTRVALAGELKVHQANLDDATAAIGARISTKMHGHAPANKPPSQAAIDREVKYAVSEELANLLKLILDCRNNLDGSETKVDVLKRKIHGLTARLEYIGSLLRFATSCKEAETEARRLQAGTPTSRWPY